MVKKTQTAKNALHVSKNYAYLKPSVLRSMANDISGTRLEACKSYAVSRLPKIAVTATLASLLACGAGLPTHQAWANGFNLPDGSYRYANRDSSTKAQRYVDIKLLPCDEKQNDNKETADRKTYGQYYKVEYQFNSNGDWWGGRPFWWASVPKDVTIVGDNITLYKHEQLTGGGSSEQTGATYTKESWNQSASRFWFDNNKEQGDEFKNNWARMTGEAGGYDISGNTLGTSREYGEATSALIINWESRGNRKSKISFVIKLNDKTKPLKFAAGVYQVMGNWHYTVGKVELAPTLPEYSKELELTYPKDKVEVDSAKYGKNLTQDEKDNILTKLWEANKSNTDVLKKLKDMPEAPTEEAFKKAVKVNNDGIATITYKDNSTDTISKENLTKRYVPLADRTKITYPDLTPVKKPTDLDKSEQKKVEDAIKNANKDKNIKSVTVDANGKATITFDDKIGTPSTKTIEGKYLVKKQRSLADKFTPYYPVPMAVGKPAQLTQGEQTELVNKVYEANKTKADFMNAIGNPSSAADAKTKNIITVDTQGNVTITYTDKSTDKLDGSKMVYKSKPLADLTSITLPARTAVDNAKSLKDEDQKKVRKAILEANSGLKSKLKDNNETNAITFDDSKNTMTVKFNDGSTSTFDYSELVYTKGNPEKPTLKTGVNKSSYTYNITKIAITDKDKPQPADWNTFARRFIQDNWKAKNGQSSITDDFINSEPSLLPMFSSPDTKSSGGMQLYKYKDKWEVKNGSKLNLSNANFGNGIVSIYLGSGGIEVKSLNGFNLGTVFTLTKDDCFVSNAAAPKPEELKQEAKDLIDKILKKNGLNDDEINKFKQEHQDEISKITKPEDVDNIIKSADKHGKDEKKKKDAQQQIENAQGNLGLTEAQKKELQKKIGHETDPEKIREKINEFQKEQDQKKQKEADQKQQQADQQAEKEKQQQQQKDDAKVDGEVTKQNQQEQQDTGKAEEAKKAAELEKQKQAAIDEIRNGEDYKNLTPGDKKQFIENIQNAADENDINTIKQQAAEKATQNQNASDNSNKEGLDKAKTDAKKKIGELTNLNARDKQKYQDEVGKADSLDKVADILNKAEFEDAKAAAKKKIVELQKNGDLTDQEATNFNTKLDDKNTDSIQDIDSILQEAELAKTRKDANTAIDNFKNLNNAQKKALKEEVANPETDPKSDLDTVDKVKTAINNVVTKAKDLDKKMSDLKTLVDLVKKQEEDLKKSEKYNDTSKKTAFDSALTNASNLVDTAKGTNADGTKVNEIKKALETAVKDLGGKTVDKSKLQDEIEIAYELQGKNKQGQDDSSKKKNPKYENASKDKKNDFDTALSSAKRVYDQKNASQQSINDAKDNLSKAIDALDGHDKSQLVAKLAEAKGKKNDASYNNASKEKQTDLNNAITSAEGIVEKAGATEKEISDAITALNDAVNGLDGQDTSTLQNVVNDANIKKSKVAYKNADKDKRDNFDKALQAAQNILNNPQGKTEEAINDAKTKLETASSALNGTVDTSKLQAEVNKADALKKSVQYTNAVQDKKSAFDAALQQAESSLTEANNNQSQKSPEEKQKAVNDALQQLQTAAAALNGVDIADLQAEIALENRVKESVKYVYDTAEKQQAYNKALQDAKELVSKLAGSGDESKDLAGKSQSERQALVDSSLKNLKNAKDALNGVNKTVLQAEVDDDSRFSKSLEYSLGEPNDLDVYKKALAEAKRVLADSNATQAQVDSALKDLQAAKNSIANKYSGAGGGNIGSGAGTDNAGTGSEAGYGVNDNAPTTVDKSELDIQIDSAESDSQPGNAGNGNAGANFGAKSGNAGNAANNNAGFNDANGANSAAVNASVENNQAVKQADAQVSKAQADVNTALAEAKRVLADPNATQAQVDAAVRNLSMARKALADAKSNAAKVRASVRSKVLKSGRADQLSNTGSNVSVFGLLAATISAAGAALLGSRRRGAYRHSNK
ncbi:GA module-containing protein [Gardnerella piotii]|uniref:GA module-containing protein n=1 Tax=Gardnerella piotii TaxID=2792977 RepID=A0ABU5MRF7_9BIFI|nr:GA module-containing protein [Gardnerella piotii]MDZ7544945.1 GA module-containing protein [Gardnerella piotii]MDZ7552809.1 GA module-containing protein [Gardnerella piotii]